MDGWDFKPPCKDKIAHCVVWAVNLHQNQAKFEIVFSTQLDSTWIHLDSVVFHNTIEHHFNVGGLVGPVGHNILPVILSIYFTNKYKNIQSHLPFVYNRLDFCERVAPFKLILCHHSHHKQSPAMNNAEFTLNPSSPWSFCFLQRCHMMACVKKAEAPPKHVKVRQKKKEVAKGRKNNEK